MDVNVIRADFPVLDQKVNGKPLVYLDNAATTQKPRQVIDTINEYYRRYNSNIHRGVHSLSEKATAAYEAARETIRDFINAPATQEIIFVRGATEGINLVAQSYGMTNLKTGDEIIISEMEHHSNIVPWQLLCERTGAVLRVIPINDDGELKLEAYQSLLGPKTKLVSIVHISNALGTINPVKQIVDLAHEHDALVLVDGAQATAHTGIDVQALDCDFYVFSGHKMFGPTGIGVLYGKTDLLNAMPPYQSGGDMIKMVTLEKTLFNELPYKFEAGTPHIAGVIGMGAAINYIKSIGLDNIAAYEHDLLDYASAAVSDIKGLKLVGTAKKKTSILSFTLGNIHAHDIGTILDHEGVAVRAGHHCAMPVMERFGIPATARASFALYNTREEVDTLVKALKKCKEIFG
ncbi:MAG: cysteine desulfurase [Gammaproteobacteria bacterium]|nr:SufS family cysteine desulfurase [Gammaproteobacteria bacterium]NIN62782.1 SufS family cysteine desulfurase [Gammaproteobacteria bacterium]NIO63763.1 SufS family cysteine desulfurase [Gammaproteobacteria bacterium]NIP50141.1 cysteine desulfurase [Gammaproteobacteria bacterium]NIQ12359.1 cysteine desulfurase [Gammaproteobacteria bacterium]